MKKLLVISTTFYPHRVVGAVRVSQWCKHLPEYGWELVVLCRYYGVAASPAELAQAVHPRVRLYYLGAQPVDNPAATVGPGQAAADRRLELKRRFTRASRGFAVPDTSRLFWRSVRSQVAAHVDRENPDAVLTTSPPHSNHDIGLWLSRARPHVPWVADFRDPYLIDSRYGPRGIARLAYPAHAAYAKRIYQGATMVTHAIPTHGRWARRRYPEQKSKVRVITNGFPAAFEGLPLPNPDRRGPCRRVLTMGVGAEHERALLAKALADEPGVTTRHIGRREGVDDRLESIGRHSCSGQLAQSDVLAELLAADVLVATLTPVASRGSGLSSKLFEFLAVGKPIVVVNPTRADRILLRRYRHAQTVSAPSDTVLRQRVRWALSDQGLPTEGDVASARARFSRKRQVEQLAAWLDALRS